MDKLEFSKLLYEQYLKEGSIDRVSRKIAIEKKEVEKLKNKNKQFIKDFKFKKLKYWINSEFRFVDLITPGMQEKEEQFADDVCKRERELQN